MKNKQLEEPTHVQQRLARADRPRITQRMRTETWNDDTVRMTPAIHVHHASLATRYPHSMTIGHKELKVRAAFDPNCEVMRQRPMKPSKHAPKPPHRDAVRTRQQIPSCESHWVGPRQDGANRQRRRHGSFTLTGRRGIRDTAANRTCPHRNCSTKEQQRHRKRDNTANAGNQGKHRKRREHCKGAGDKSKNVHLDTRHHTEQGGQPWSQPHRTRWADGQQNEPPRHRAGGHEHGYQCTCTAQAAKQARQTRPNGQRGKATRPPRSDALTREQTRTRRPACTRPCGRS